MDPSEIEADHRALQQANVEGAVNQGAAHTSANEDVIKATVDQIVAQILSESAERSAAEASKKEKDKEAPAQTSPPDSSTTPKQSSVEESTAPTPSTPSSGSTALPNTGGSGSNSPLPASPAKYSNPTNLTIGARLEALNAEGNWMPARIVEVNETEQTLLVRFERNHKQKTSPSTSGGSQEWMAIKSEKLRQRLSNRVLPVFALDEKCMARWSGPRKFPGTVRKLLGNDTYEVLFDDGYTKNVRAVHMNKLPRQQLPPAEAAESAPTSTEVAGAAASPALGTATAVLSQTSKRPSTGTIPTVVSAAKKSKSTPQRKDWPLLDMSSLDLGNSLCIYLFEILSNRYNILSNSCFGTSGYSTRRRVDLSLG